VSETKPTIDRLIDAIKGYTDCVGNQCEEGDGDCRALAVWSRPHTIPFSMGATAPRQQHDYCCDDHIAAARATDDHDEGKGAKLEPWVLVVYADEIRKLNAMLKEASAAPPTVDPHAGTCGYPLDPCNCGALERLGLKQRDRTA
jgi:hypothetical protein